MTRIGPLALLEAVMVGTCVVELLVELGMASGAVDTGDGAGRDVGAATAWAVTTAFAEASVEEVEEVAGDHHLAVDPLV